MRVLLLVASIAVVVGAGNTVLAQPFPNEPVRIIVAFPAGGGTDIITRIIGSKLSEGLGQPVVIHNRGGAGGIIGTEAAAKAPPDGYTIFMGTLGNLSVNSLLYKNVPFDVARDFTAITRVVSVTFMLFVHPSLPVTTARELAALARTREIHYASGGIGSGPHLAAELFNSVAGVKLVNVAYKGSAPAIADVISGQVPVAFYTVAEGYPHVKSGRLRVIGALGSHRASAFPELPTIGESLPGYQFDNWFGLVAPAATPRDIVNRLNAEVLKVLRDPDIRKKLAAAGADPVGDTPEQFATYLKSETAKWARVVKEANIRTE